MRKRCSKCGKAKPLEAYTKFAKGKDGRRAQCKECDKRYRNKRKKQALPREGDSYELNNATMSNHFYLHFGFTDRRYNATEYGDYTKYKKEYILIKNNNK